MKTRIDQRHQEWSTSCHAQPIHVFNSPLKYVFSPDDLEARLAGENAKELHRNLRDFTELVSEENEIKSWNFLATRLSLLLRTYENIEVVILCR